jgi:hypothetical protein
MLEKFRMGKLESTKYAMLVKWILVGNKCLWAFFEFHKGHRLHTMIKKLLHGWQIITKKDIT